MLLAHSKRLEVTLSAPQSLYSENIEAANRLTGHSMRNPPTLKASPVPSDPVAGGGYD